MEIKEIVMTLSILLAAGFSFIGDGTETPTHYCDDRLYVAECDSLSETKKTCYTLPLKQGGKRCLTVWQNIDSYTISSNVLISQVQQKQPFNDFTRDTDGIHCYLKGDLRRRVNCNEI